MHFGLLFPRLARLLRAHIAPFCRLHCDATTRTYQPAQKPLIKVCGVTNAGDAELAAKAGADFVGMILWAKARRAVSVDTAAKISEAARKAGAEPVGVFVDENFADIVRVCKKAGIKTAQLHGKGARGSLHDLPNWLEVGSASFQKLATCFAKKKAVKSHRCRSSTLCTPQQTARYKRKTPTLPSATARAAGELSCTPLETWQACRLDPLEHPTRSFLL